VSRRSHLHMSQMDDNQRMNLSDFLAGAALWGGVGGIGGLRGSGLTWFALLGPIAEKALGFQLEEILVAAERQRQERERQEGIALIRSVLQSIALKPSSTTVQPAQPLPLLQAPKAESETPANQKPADIERDSEWLRVIVHPSVVVILGRRGGGKSVLGYRLLELFRYKLTPCVLGIPRQAQRLLPEWIGVFQDLEDIPRASIVLVDEAYLRFHARDSHAARSREMSQIINLSRQKEQTFVFVTQESRQLDKNVVSCANVLVFKDLGMLQVQFDRPELRSVTAQARRALEAVDGDRRGWSYVYSPDAKFMGPLENSLPTFWSRGMSHAFASDGGASATRLPKRLTLDERIHKAKELCQNGLSMRQVARVMGVSHGTVFNYVRGYPHMKSGSNRAAKGNERL
jgi:hypothetical protein